MNSRHVVAVLGQRVWALRKARGMNRQQVAAAAHIHATTVRYLETGRQGDTTLHTLVGLSWALQVPMAVLVGEQPMPTGEPPAWPQIRAEVEQLREVA